MRRRVASAADAEDLVSKVFHKLVENVGRFDRRKAGAKTWVLTMARNAVIDHYRTRKVSVSVDELADGLGDGDGGPLQVLIDDEEARAVAELMEAYPPRVRTMLALRYGDGLKHREIARLMDMSEAAVKQRLSRTLKDMRERSTLFSRRGVVDFAV